MVSTLWLQGCISQLVKIYCAYISFEEKYQNVQCFMVSRFLTDSIELASPVSVKTMHVPMLRTVFVCIYDVGCSSAWECRVYTSTPYSMASETCRISTDAIFSRDLHAFAFFIIIPTEISESITHSHSSNPSPYRPPRQFDFISTSFRFSPTPWSNWKTCALEFSTYSIFSPSASPDMVHPFRPAFGTDCFLAFFRVDRFNLESMWANAGR